MKLEYIYERRQTAGNMEVVMLAASVIGTVTAILVLFIYGWLPSFALFLLSLCAFALSRMFDVLAALLAAIEQANKSTEQSRSGKDKNAV